MRPSKYRCTRDFARHLKGWSRPSFYASFVLSLPSPACILLDGHMLNMFVGILIRVWQFYLMGATLKLCCTKLNSYEIPSQIYSWFVPHLLYIYAYVYWLKEHDSLSIKICKIDYVVKDRLYNMSVFGIKVYHATSTLEFFRSNMNYEHLEVIV